MNLKIKIPVKNRVSRERLQAAIVYGILTRKHNALIKVLAYMIKYQVNGIYIAKRGHLEFMAKSVGISRPMARKAIKILTKDHVVKFVSNGEKNNLGSYAFGKAVEGLFLKPTSLTFDFILRA